LKKCELQPSQLIFFFIKKNKTMHTAAGIQPWWHEACPAAAQRAACKGVSWLSLLLLFLKYPPWGILKSLTSVFFKASNNLYPESRHHAPKFSCYRCPIREVHPGSLTRSRPKSVLQRYDQGIIIDKCKSYRIQNLKDAACSHPSQPNSTTLLQVSNPGDASKRPVQQQPEERLEKVCP
jgi:hypothetical protein